MKLMEIFCLCKLSFLLEKKLISSLVSHHLRHRSRSYLFRVLNFDFGNAQRSFFKNDDAVINHFPHFDLDSKQFFWSFGLRQNIVAKNCHRLLKICF